MQSIREFSGVKSAQKNRVRQDLQKDTEETFFKDKPKNPLQLCYSQHFIEGILV